MVTAKSPHPRYGFEITDFVVIGCMALLTVIAAAFVDSIPSGSGPAIAFATVLIAYIALIRAVDRLNLGMNWRLFIRSAALCVAYPVAFMQLGHVIEFINPFRAEILLMQIDRAIFWGQNPNVLLQDYLNPLAVDIFQSIYALYYPFFLVLLVLLRFGEQHRFIQYLTSVALLFSLQFFLYMLVPARSPYVIAQMPEYHAVVGLTQSVQGGWLGNLIRESLHGAEGLKFDCFPSGHTAGAVLVLISLTSWRRVAGLIAAPVAAALVFSTVYLQYHYVIDVLAGVILALVVFYLGRWLGDRYPLFSPASRGNDES